VDGAFAVAWTVTHAPSEASDKLLDASRDAVDKLRLDGTPTPRSWVARMTKRPTPTGAWQERLRAGGPDEGYSRYGKQTGAVQH